MNWAFFLSALVWVAVALTVVAGQAVPPSSIPAAPSGSAATSSVREPRPTVTRPAAAATGGAAAMLPADADALAKKYCVGCHNARTKMPAADPLDLASADVMNPASAPRIFERVIRKLGVGAMPPQGSPHPGPAALSAFSEYLVTSLDRAAAEHVRPGDYVAHRLNRTEYANAVRDLLAVNFNALDMLPSDGGNFGFDNIAASLKVSPLLLERYLTAALAISTQAVGDPQVASGVATFNIPLDRSQNEYVEGLPLGTRGGLLIRHHFPANGEYEISGRLHWAPLEGLGGVEGHEYPHELVITIDGEQAYSALIGGPLDHESNTANVTTTRPIIEGRLSGRVFVTAGVHEVGVTWVEQPGENQSVWQPPQRDSQDVHVVAGPPRLRTIYIEGPARAAGVDRTASRNRVFVCTPTSAASEPSCARRIFTSLARRAFRRPVNTADLEAPMAFYAQARREGGTFEVGIADGIARILSSPAFLYRIEQAPAFVRPGQAYTISDLELASRLSFFLWSSIPDDQLLDLAVNGQLRKSDALDAQIRRMIADPRADAFVAAFAGQWLALRSLESKVAPDVLMYPNFDDNVRKGFRRETELLFADVLRENKSVLTLLNADYTFVNERLARFYGIPGVYGPRFRRVTLTDPNRFGVLGHGSLQSVTALANRTSPTIRGTFILTTLMGLPTPVPPPDVPALDEGGPGKKPLTVRERVESHRRNPVCASCHRSIDPLGFALENFDSAGQWRTTAEGGAPVDSSGVLQDGTPVNGPIDLRNWLTQRPGVFVGNVTERLVIYALGRGLEPHDMPVVRGIVRRAARDGYRLQTIIKGIVESAPFHRRVKPASPAVQPDGGRVAQTVSRSE